MRTRLTTLLLALCLMLVVSGPTTWASPSDYGPMNSDWQGTSKLWDLARSLGYDVDVRSKLEWNDLKPNEVLFILYPTTELPRKKLITFLRGGGRLILADDFGTSDALLNQLGVTRIPVQGHRIARLHAENPNLPIATPGISHPLNSGIGELVTNHPAAFETKLPAIYRFEPRGGAVVVAATLGKGRVVLLSDPSILINRMLQFPGNAAFAKRLLEYLARAGEDRFVVLIQDFEEQGAPKADVKVTAPPPDGITAVLVDANNLLSEFNEYLIDRVWIMPVATLLAGLLLALAVWVMPMVRPLYDASWTRPGQGPPPARYERDLAPYLNGGRRKLNYAYPAAVLRDVIDNELEEKLGVAAPLLTMDEHALADQVQARGGRKARAACERLIQLARRVPARDQVTPYTLTPRYGLRDLERLRQTGAELLDNLSSRGAEVTEPVAPAAPQPPKSEVPTPS